MSRILGYVALLTSVMLWSCAAHGTEPVDDVKAADAFFRLLGAREHQQSSAAYLALVKVSSPKFKKRFKLEVFVRNDTISFYSPGFVGQGSFKGLLFRDSISFYLPAQNKYYSGRWADLAEPQLGRWAEPLSLLRDLLSGQFAFVSNPDAASGVRPRDKYDRLVSSENWLHYYRVKGGNLERMLNAWDSEPLGIEVRTQYRRQDFPYFKLARIDLRHSGEKFHIRVDFLDQKYNLDIPASKFALPIPDGAERIDRLELR